MKLHSNPKTQIIIVDVHPVIPSNIEKALGAHIEHCIQLLKTASRVELTKTGPKPSDT